jgi:hypothetical protein
MNEDLIVKRRSAAEIHALALDWRRALQIETEWSPNLVETFENRLPKIILGFELVAQDDALLNGAEGFARYPRIFIRKSIRQRALDWDGRSRMTLAHELATLLCIPMPRYPGWWNQISLLQLRICVALQSGRHANLEPFS